MITISETISMIFFGSFHATFIFLGMTFYIAYQEKSKLMTIISFINAFALLLQLCLMFYGTVMPVIPYYIFVTCLFINVGTWLILFTILALVESSNLIERCWPKKESKISLEKEND